MKRSYPNYVWFIPIHSLKGSIENDILDYIVCVICVFDHFQVSVEVAY